MGASLILQALRFLPMAVDAGFAVRDLAQAVAGKDIGRHPSDVERYALGVIEQVPALIDAGQEVVSILNEANAKVREMVSQNRAPTPEEWDAVNSKIAEKLAAINKP